MTPTQLLAVVATIALCAIVAGAGLQWGVPSGLMSAGALVLAAVVVLYDPDKRP